VPEGYAEVLAASAAKHRSQAPVNGGRNYQLTEVVVKLGYMLERPGVSGATSAACAVTMRPVRTISRKGLAELARTTTNARGILRDYTPSPAQYDRLR
jgi:hypothetical protein